ncbi:STE3-like pheromone receptor [Dendrothele bispora CBS 962.96]|uniref:STE3-like pheromone receptor n=1 Tax=Dendrothele bispora (strain CBS 962.96) TaxID=1314807 RepID=A0A4S8KLD7_DENBC|nr:STE3-like pheromone receptor [Dendrothele bispora CBS 962.96]
MRSSDPTFPLFPVFSLLGFILCTIPLTWHVQAWNAGTCAYMIWTGIQCLVEFINSLVWAGNVKNVAPVWCDISVQLLQGAGLGIPASVLCISRRLYKITSSQVASSTRRDKIRALIVDLCISVGIPILGLVMHFIVQSHRFDILEDVGCYPATYNTLPAYFLSVSWPIALGCASFVYSALNLRNFYRQRLQFAQFSSLSAMNTSRYLRLMILSMVDMMFTVPLGIFIIYSGTKGVPLQPWISWEDTHFDFGQVHFFPALLWRFKPSYRIAVELTRWSSVFCAFLFFALFGFASEAKKHYRMFFWFVVKPFGFKPAGPSAPKSPLDGYVIYTLFRQ